MTFQLPTRLHYTFRTSSNVAIKINIIPQKADTNFKVPWTTEAWADLSTAVR